MKSRHLLAVLPAVLILSMGIVAHAADHQVRMLNRGDAGVMVFEPAALRIQPGDTVTFLSVDPGHNAETMPGMFPEQAKPFRTAFSKDETVTFEVPGIYALKCMPHLAMGMVMVVQVGDDTHNLETVKTKKTAPIAMKRLEAAFAELGL